MWCWRTEAGGAQPASEDDDNDERRVPPAGYYMGMAENIDEARARAAKERAEQMIAKGGLSDKEYKIAEAKLQRALVRLNVKQ